jgi:hypothetical protein
MDQNLGFRVSKDLDIGLTENRVFKLGFYQY